MPRIERNEFDIHIGSQLRKLRQHCKMSMRELGEMLGISYQQVQKYEAAKNSMNGALLFHIAGLFEISIVYFFDGLEQDISPAPPLAPSA